MLRRDAHLLSRGDLRVQRIAISQSIENHEVEGTKKQRFPLIIITETYKYFSDGVQILGQAYSTYDDRNAQ